MSVTARLADTLLLLLAGTYVLYRHNVSKLRQSLYWGLGLISLGIVYLFALGFAANLIGSTEIPSFIQETFLSFSMTLFYYGCATALTKNRFYSTFLAWTILILQEAVTVYFLVLSSYLMYYLTELFIHLALFVVPVYIFMSVFFYLDFHSLRRRSSLLVALSFLFQLLLLPIFFLTYLMPSYWLFYAGEAATYFLQVVGFILLAHSR